MRSARALWSAIVLKTSTLLHLYYLLRKRKYHLSFSQQSGRRLGPKGPNKELIDALVAMKRRNPSWGCPRIAQQIALAFRRRNRQGCGSPCPERSLRAGFDFGTWLTLLGHAKDSLWNCDLFRCESATLRTHWILVLMHQFTRRVIGFGFHSGIVNGVPLCRMFQRAIRG